MHKNNIRTKIITVIIILLGFLLLNIFIFYKNYSHQLNNYLSSIQKDKKNLIKIILELNTLNVINSVKDYAIWDDMFKFVESENKEWANNNLKDYIIDFNIDFIRIINTNGKIAYENYANYVNLSSIDKDFLEYFLENQPKQFYITIDDKLVEIVACRIFNNSKTKSNGYMITGKILDNEYLERISYITGVKVYLDINNKYKFENKKNKYYYYLNTQDNTRAAIVFSLEDEFYNRTVSENIRFIVFNIIYVLIIVVIIYYFLYKDITMPVNIINNLLKKFDKNLVNKLKLYKNEFGKIGELIDENHNKSFYLNVIFISQSILLKCIDIKDGLSQSLSLISSLLEVDNINIYQNLKDGNEIKFFSLRYSWSSTKNLEEIKESIIYNYDENYKRWLNNFIMNKIIKGNLRDFPEEEMTILINRKYKSILCVPLQFEETCWGFIEFGDSKYIRTWDEVDINSIFALATGICGSIIRKDIENSFNILNRELEKKLYN